MSAVINKAAWKARNELAWDLTSGQDTEVDVITIDGSSGLVSLTRELPAWDHEIRVSAKVAIDGLDSGHLFNTRFAFGLCAGHTRRYGQTGEYVLTPDYTSRPTVWVASTHASTIPSGINYYWTRSSWPTLWNADVQTRNGSGYGCPVAKANVAFSDGVNATHGSHGWTALMVWARKGSPNWTFGYHWATSPNWNVPRLHYRTGHDGAVDYTTREAWQIMPRKIAGSYGWVRSYGTFAIDETTYGPLKNLNIAWEQPDGAILLVRDLMVSAQRRVYP